MAQHVEQILQAPDIFIAAKHRIGCIAHIINLAAQVIIQDALKAPAPENDSDDDYEGEGTVLEDPGTLLRRFRADVRRIRSSPQRIEHYRRCCRAVETTRFITESDQDVYGDAVVDADSHVDGKMLVLDVRTRWNSTFHMIQRGLEMSRAYNMTCMGIPELNGHILTDDDWSTLQQIATLLLWCTRIAEDTEDIG
ncbi:predicted protein [Lichtheimia corymbifera JMRC:FSU:9682]|uniref:Uncharacterized protein n=1 Tax=Lichtheimia corymbifera JMRC:FSU:9682 TaxID=1263082 RepID=A0A068SFQ7_9FUNG|nr:predicted protein [Lichtheimia corymbifera JMRC:FSU:9682]